MKADSEYDLEYIKDELHEIRGELLDLKSSIDVLKALISNFNYRNRHD